MPCSESEIKAVPAPDPISATAVVARNALFLFAGELVARTVAAAAAIAVVRVTTPEQYGLLGVAMAAGGIAHFCGDLGLTHITIREGTKPGADVRAVLGTAMRARIGIAIAATAAAFALLPAVYSGSRLRTLVFLMVIPTLWASAISGLGSSYFWLTQRMQYSAVLKIVGSAAMAVAVGTAIALHLGIEWIAAAYGLGALLGAAVSLALAWPHVELRGRWDPSSLSGLGGFTARGVAAIILPQLGPLILEKASTIEQVGYFAAAARIPLVIITIPATIAAAYYPQLFSAGHRDHSAHVHFCVQGLSVNLVLTTLLALPLIAFPAPVIHFICGEQWVAQSAAVLAVLGWGVVFASMASPLADTLTTMGLQKRCAVIFGVVLALAIPLFWICGREWGALGGATATLATQAGLCCALVALTPGRRAYFFNRTVALVGLGALAAAGSAALGSLLQSLWLAGGVTLASVIIIWVAARMTSRRTLRELIEAMFGWHPSFQ